MQKVPKRSRLKNIYLLACFAIARNATRKLKQHFLALAIANDKALLTIH